MKNHGPNCELLKATDSTLLSGYECSCPEDGESFTIRKDQWRVRWLDRICTPVFNSKGVAEAYLEGLRNGRKPEV